MVKLDRSRILSAMKAAPIFSSLEEPAVAAILEDSLVQKFQASQQVFFPTQAADRFYLVLDGRVKIYKLSAGGDEQILHLYGSGETFAEAVVLAGRNYPAFAEAVEPSELLAVRRGTLRRAISANADIALGMLAGMSAKLQEFNRLIEQLSLKDVPARLAGWLLEARGQGELQTIQLRQTKRQLAGQIGTVPETLSRAFAKLSKQGLIKVHGREIRILDPDGLEQLAGG
jgi:CRP/FNR family transcriptional regulator